MNAVYLTIIWFVSLGYIGFNLYHKDFIGRVFACVIFIAAVVYTIAVLGLLGGV